MEEKVFAIAGNYGYINQITTTLKSIVYHNQKVKVYILNPDIPQEWFYNINCFMEKWVIN